MWPGKIWRCIGARGAPAVCQLLGPAAPAVENERLAKRHARRSFPAAEPKKVDHTTAAASPAKSLTNKLPNKEPSATTDWLNKPRFVVDGQCNCFCCNTGNRIDCIALCDLQAVCFGLRLCLLVRGVCFLPLGRFRALFHLSNLKTTT